LPTGGECSTLARCAASRSNDDPAYWGSLPRRSAQRPQCGRCQAASGRGSPSRGRCILRRELIILDEPTMALSLSGTRKVLDSPSRGDRPGGQGRHSSLTTTSFMSHPVVDRIVVSGPRPHCR
jgi:hypothetical protein